MSQVTVTWGTTGNITFVNTYDTDASYITSIELAESTIGALWTSSSSITVTLDFISAVSGPVASNEAYSYVPVTYSELTSKLPSWDTLPPDPTSGGFYYLPEAYARMLGLSTITPPSSSFDAQITLNTNSPDLISAIEHEITENAMGRIGGLGAKSYSILSAGSLQYNIWGAPDLFRYSNGTYDKQSNDTTYFSANGGSTISSLAFFNGNNSHAYDTADLESDATGNFGANDVFGGGAATFSQIDYQMMDALGWEPILPELEIKSGSLTSSTATVKAGDTISLSATVKNYGAMTAGAFQTQFYISASATFDRSSAIAIGNPISTSSLASGSSITLNETATVPNITAGTEHLFAVPDYLNQVTQLTTNNVSYSIPITVIPAMTAIHWKSGISGNFDDGFNWSTGGVPSASDDALIDATGTYAVEITSPLTQTVHSLTLVAGATLNITNGEFDLDFFGADTNNGTINVYSHLAVFGALDNTGLIDCIGGPTFSPPYSAVIAYFQPTGTSTNSGTIEAVTGAEISFNITPVSGPSSFTNYGTIEAASGSEITIGGNFGATSSFTNLGTIEALGQNSLVDLFSASGTITNSGYLVADGGTIQISNPNSISGSGTADIRNGGTLFIGTSFAENTTFDPGANGTLKLGLGAAFTGTLSGFTTGDRIDLSDLPYSGSALTFDSLNNGLTVSNGTYSTTIHLSGSYVASGFKLSADASGSAQVTYIAPVESVNSYIFDNTVFDQTSDAALLVPWFYFFSIGATFLTAGDYSTASASYPGPDSPQTLALIAPTTFNFSSPAFTSFSTLQDAYPFGTYTVTGTGNQISSTSSVSYQANYFTSTVPFVTNYSSLNGFDPANDFTVHHNSFTPDPHVTTGFTFLTIWNANTHQVVFQDFFQSPSSTTDLIPANTLSPNTDYTFELDFSDRLIVGSSTQGFDMRTDGSFTTGPIVQTDHPPVIDLAHSKVADTIDERPSTTGSLALDIANGAIAFTDADLNDRPTASVTHQALVYYDAHGKDVTSELSPTQITAFENAFLIVPESSNTNNGKIDWGFTAQDSVFDFLGVGETVVVTSTVEIYDGHGGTAPSSNILVTINGTDDEPVAWPDIATVQKGETVKGDVTANNYDPDIHDALLLHVSAVNGLDFNVGQSIVGSYGTLTLNADRSYTYVANSNAKAGAQDVFSYEVNDGHTGTAASVLVFAIAKEGSSQVSLPFTGNYSVTQGPDDGKFGDHNGFSKWSYDFNLPYDINHHIGTPVLAVGHGTVIDLREYVPDGALSSMITDKHGNLIPDPLDPSNGSGNFGNYVTIQLDDGTYVSYLHLGQNEVSVSIGQEVNVGDVLGFTGLTGARTGPHLHIEFGTGRHISNAITDDPLAKANHVSGIIADGSGDKFAPEYFANLSVHLDGPNNLYNAGPGVENFLFNSLGDGGYTINGFQHAVDIIDLSALDANSRVAGHQEFLFAGQSANVVANSVTWYEKGQNTILQADVNGDHVADFTLTLAGVNHHLSATDFLL